MLPENKKLEPVIVQDGCYAKAMALCIWKSKVNYEFFKLCGIIHNVVHFEKLKNFVSKAISIY